MNEPRACPECLEAAGYPQADHGATWAICRCQPGYPPQLMELEERTPPVLWGFGKPELLISLQREEAVTIVGSRRASPYGLEIARELGRLLASAGLVIVSGMAFGIDAASHLGALDGAGRTLAVLAGGPDQAYPPSKAGLHRRIVESGGVCIAEHPPGVTPTKWAFPARNRIMAALSEMTIVVEAAEPSGTLITAREATELHRNVGAVPGPVTARGSAGCHSLLKDGAALIRDAQDVLDELLGVGMTAVRGTGPALDDRLRSVIEVVEGGARSLDDITQACGVSAGDAAVALARLELMGYLHVSPDGAFSRTPLFAPE